MTPETRRLIDAYLAMNVEAREQVIKIAEAMAVRHPAERPALLRLVSNNGGKTFL
jgi:hypothetical protein